MTATTAPCGNEYDTVQDALDHAATCPMCSGAVEQRRAATRPLRRTKTLRESYARDARSALAMYQQGLGDDKNPQQVRRLGWALAHIERALYHETGGRYGVQHSSSVTALRRQQQWR